MTKQELEEFVRVLDNPSLAKEPGMVCQVWQDGEITTQKSGELLWQRTLHCLMWAIPGAKELGLQFPHKHGENSFAWVSDEDAHRVRAAVKELTKNVLEVTR